jgi:hypothetical protein
VNAALVALGCASLVGCLAHVALGERYIIARLQPETLPVSLLGDGDVTKRYLRWFWHVGTVAIGGGGLALGACGLSLLPDGAVLARVVSIQYLAMFAAFLIVERRGDPREVRREGFVLG